MAEICEELEILSIIAAVRNYEYDYVADNKYVDNIKEEFGYISNCEPIKLLNKADIPTKKIIGDIYYNCENSHYKEILDSIYKLKNKINYNDFLEKNAGFYLEFINNFNEINLEEIETFYKSFYRINKIPFDYNIVLLTGFRGSHVYSNRQRTTLFIGNKKEIIKTKATIFHELSHKIIKQVASDYFSKEKYFNLEYQNQLKKSKLKFLQKTTNSKKRSKNPYYITAPHLLEEYMVRGATLAYIEINFGKEKADDKIKRDISEGLEHVESFYKAFMKYYDSQKMQIADVIEMAIEDLNKKKN